MLSNFIDLFDEDYSHMVEGHPEMDGRQDLVKQAIQSPAYIQASLSPMSAAYVLEPTGEFPEGVRVLVKFPTEMWPDGSKNGFVTTGYPIDTKNYPAPALGPIVWASPERGKK